MGNVSTWRASTPSAECSGRPCSSRRTKRASPACRRESAWVVGLDEKSIARGQIYATIACDLDDGHVIGVAPERTRESVLRCFGRFSLDDLSGIKAIAMDMCLPFISTMRIAAQTALLAKPSRCCHNPSWTKPDERQLLLQVVFNDNLPIGPLTAPPAVASSGYRLRIASRK